jgi:2-amino-4-hydroxy-6-hydroxymethyldihydropteridine diphosphokinase
MINNIFLGLGSNKGDKLTYLRNTISEISNDAKCRLIKVSSVYETSPLGNINQDNFYNCVIEVETLYGVKDFYFNLKSIEYKFGRQEIYDKWSPREIDIDILFYNNLIYDDNIITIPHKEILNRDFVLTPLLEIAENFVHPVLKKRLAEIDMSMVPPHIIQKLNFLLI